MASIKQLENAVMDLLSNGRFRSTWVNKDMPRASQRRTLIGDFVSAEHILDTVDKEMISRFLAHMYGMPAAIHGTENGARDLGGVSTTLLFQDRPMPAVPKEKEPLMAVGISFNSQYQTKEPPVSAKFPDAIEIDSKTFINGVEAANYPDSEIYNLIASEEKLIEKLKTIINKPKRLEKEIAKRQAGIEALVAHLDAKDGDKPVG